MCPLCLHVPFTYLVIASIELLPPFKISIKEYSSWLTEKPARLQTGRLADRRPNVVSLIFLLGDQLLVEGGRYDSKHRNCYWLIN